MVLEENLLVGKPKVVYAIISLFILLILISSYWEVFVYSIIIQIPGWINELGIEMVSILFWIFFIANLLWIGSITAYILLIYGIFKQEKWGWNASMIISSIIIVIFTIMLIGFIVSVILFQAQFTVVGIVTVIIAFFADLGILYFLTRSTTRKIYKKN